MKLLTKTLPRAATVLIMFWILQAICSQFITIEFVYSSDEEFFEIFRFWSLPTAILLTLPGIIKATDKASLVTSKVFLALMGFALSLLILFFSLLSGMCRWVTAETVFVHTGKEDDKIVLRAYGCGAWDSGPPKTGIVRARNITSRFVWISAVDTNLLDRKIWKEVTRQ